MKPSLWEILLIMVRIPWRFLISSATKAKRVLGNHDAAASSKIDCRSSPPMHNASVATREVITCKLTPRKPLDLLGKAERKLNLEYDGLMIRALHAEPGDELYKYLTRDEAEKVDMGGADLMLLGHTHMAYEVKNSTSWIVNPGSVGMPQMATLGRRM